MHHLLMIATAIANKGRRLGNFKGPGPQTLQYGEDNLGFFGEVTSQDLMRGDLLAAAVGLTTGTSQNEVTNWLKFSHYGKVLFIPKKSLRFSLTWNALYAAGLVYGIDGPGLYTSTIAGPVNQKKIIVIGKNAFIVRLMTGAKQNPYTELGGEWSDLMYRVGAFSPLPIEERWANYSTAELNSGDGSAGSRTHMQETPVSNTANRLVRYAADSTTTYTANTTSTLLGWRPVLELIPNDEFLFEMQAIAQDIPGAVLEPVGFSSEFNDAIYVVKYPSASDVDSLMPPANITYDPI